MSLRRQRASWSVVAGQPLTLTIRPAFPDDAAAIAVLATLDDARVPPEPLLLAEVAGELWAAVSLSTLEAVADPFNPSAEVAAILEQRAQQLRAAHMPKPRRPWLRLKRTQPTSR
jgi:hypothetical protein